MTVEEDDKETAAAFSHSWNHIGSVYTRAQFLDWMAPLDLDQFRGGMILELGFGNGSLLAHTGTFSPSRLSGIELGDTIERTMENLRHLPQEMLDLHRGDLTKLDLGEFDFVYCIGVLHHLKKPGVGFDAVLRSTRPGGAFHCWVYAREGNGLIRWAVEPLRRLSCHLPWWLTKYAIALPLVVPYFVAARVLRHIPSITRRLPLGEYTLWIGGAPFSFFRHVAFDQLVTPETVYIDRTTIDSWLSDPRIDPSSTYVTFRNGNSWKFGGQRRSSV